MVENRAEAVQIVDGTLLWYEARVKRAQSTMLPWRPARAQQASKSSVEKPHERAGEKGLTGVLFKTYTHF